MTTLQVEVDNFLYAARTMHHNIGESVRMSLQGMTNTLQANPDLVGEDSAGAAWAAGYDPAALNVLEATAQVINAAFRTSQLFAQSGANYAAAEISSTAGGSSADNAELAELITPQPIMRAPHLPGSAGAGNGSPSGWWIVEHTVGYVWPGGHQDRLRATAQGWRQAAGGIANVAFDPVLVNAVFAADRLPEADDIGKICGGFHTRLNDLVRGYRSLGRACDDYADALDECHEAVRSELNELLAESVGIQVVGAVASIFSLGAAQAPTQAAQAARIAAVAARIGGLIEKVIAVARRVSEGVRAVALTAQEMTRALQGLVGARLAVAGVKDVPRATRVLQSGRAAGRALRMGRSGEALPGSARIAGEVRGGRRAFATKTEAREAFESGPLRATCRRFFKKATEKTSDYQVVKLQDGSYRMQFFAAANNPGYGKLYVKILSEDGKTLASFKDTLGPQGLIERKHLPTHD